MKSVTNYLIALSVGIFHLASVFAGTPIKVTFCSNTSGVPDTLHATSTVQIRGSGSVLTWDNNSPARMTNAFGEYWKDTVIFNAGDTIQYKYFTNVKSNITGSDSGWEGAISDWGNGNRRLIVGQNDTILPLEYVNGFQNPATQWQAPFPTAKKDTFVCYLRVNMQSFLDFNPSLMKVGVRGSFPASNWTTSLIMTPEPPHPNAGQNSYDAAHFYTAAIYWPTHILDSASSYEGKVMRYKFVIHRLSASPSEDWSLLISNPDQQFEFVMPKRDTVPAWRWYYIPPIPIEIPDSVMVKFRTDLSTVIKNKGIKPSDTIIVKCGYFGSASQIYSDTLKTIGLSANIYETQFRSIRGRHFLGRPLGYQYYLLKNGTEYREVYYNFSFEDLANGFAEKRSVALPGVQGGSIAIIDTISSVTALHRRPHFQGIDNLSRNVRVTFTCDLRPAYYSLAAGDTIFDAQGSFRTIIPADKDSVFHWGVWLNGPAVGGWSNPGGSDWGDGLRSNLAKKMYDDGTHGDKSPHDSIYSIAIRFYKDSLNNTIGQVFRFGLNAGDNESGKGGFGNNEVFNINDEDSVTTISSQFGQINPLYYKGWDFDRQVSLITLVSRRASAIAIEYDLSQNYPNPFNPSTTITFSIPHESQVSLRIFNMLGQEIATLVPQRLPTGTYTADWDASGFPSGVYFYSLRTRDYIKTKKLLLLK